VPLPNHRIQPCTLHLCRIPNSFATDHSFGLWPCLILYNHSEGKLVGSKYLCVAEGIIYRDDVSEQELRLLQKYKSNPPTLVAVEHFPAQTEPRLTNRPSFVSSVFWNAIKKGQLIVSFNSPFDLSRLATWSHKGKNKALIGL